MTSDGQVMVARRTAVSRGRRGKWNGARPTHAEEGRDALPIFQKGFFVCGRVLASYSLEPAELRIITG